MNLILELGANIWVGKSEVLLGQNFHLEEDANDEIEFIFRTCELVLGQFVYAWKAECSALCSRAFYVCDIYRRSFPN